MSKSNASAGGFAAEKDLIEKIAEYCDVEQHYYKPSREESHLIRYKVHDLCTSTKLYMGGKCRTENDCVVILKSENKILSKFTDNIYGIDSYENAMIQSKKYSKGRNVKTDSIKHDGTNILITPIICSNLIQDSFLVCNNVSEDSSKKIESYGAKIISPEKFKRNIETIINMGNNAVSFDKYVEKKHIPHSIELGELRLVKNEGNIRIINYINPENIDKNPLKKNISSLDERISTVIAGFKAQLHYFKPEYFIYSTMNGELDNEGREFLKDLHATEATYETVLNSFRKGEFFKNFQKIDLNAYAIKDIALWNAKWEMLNTLKVGLRENGIKIPHSKIWDCIDYFFKK